MQATIPKLKLSLLQEMNSVLSSRAICPFFKYGYDSSKYISCKDFMNKKYTFEIRIGFNNVKERNSYGSVFCCENFESCDMYKILYKRGGYDGRKQV